MEELLRIIAVNLVGDEQLVAVESREDSRAVNLRLYVREDCIGRVIGRQGRIARAIRTLVRANAPDDGRRVTVDIEPMDA